MAFYSQLDNNGYGIYTSTGNGVITTIADSEATNGGMFRNFGDNQRINASGTVAFFANLDAGGSGIFASYSGSTLPFAVVKTGDVLFGSEVTDVSLSMALNDNNQLAFQYQLADFRRGVAVANITAVAVPEVGSLALVACGLLAGVGVVARRHTSR
ncbi:MAG: hypothetical protein H7Y38_11650 [Armatimonadetes bacterium]|nr:hypothetical protein [Armatimonadota bacterium]